VEGGGRSHKAGRKKGKEEKRLGGKGKRGGMKLTQERTKGATQGENGRDSRKGTRKSRNEKSQAAAGKKECSERETPIKHVEKDWEKNRLILLQVEGTMSQGGSTRKRVESSKTERGKKRNPQLGQEEQKHGGGGGKE